MTSRPTHFLSLFIGHHAQLRAAVSALHDSFTTLEPPLTVDKRYIEPSSRLHVTCGVMPLTSKERINEALELLRSCRSSLLDILDGRTLKIRLQGLGCFPEGSVRKARVLWLQPHSAEDQTGLLKKVAEHLHSCFVDAGFIKEPRPLVLHATLVKCPPTRRDRFDVLENGLITLPADCGEWDVPDVRLCRMGTYLESGEHFSEGSISLLADE